jgi:biopolymer transport protein ExbD
MANRTTPYDIWIVESNTVYRGVPFTIITDWIQEGRLLNDDRVRQAGKSDWHLLSEDSTFEVYFPKPVPHEAEDRAEALEPVELPLKWKGARADEDEDVDMIPLIDVSLVLLIFFMMTATVTSAGSLIKTPEAIQAGELTSNPKIIWIGVEQGVDGRTLYSLGRGDQPASEEDRLLNRPALLKKLRDMLREQSPGDIMLRAHEDTPEKVIKELRADLEAFRSQGFVKAIKDQVREGQRP